jgi:phosphatidylglycerophosphate synthase
VNLPNSITVARIAVMPLVATLPFVESWEWRLAAFVLYIAAAVTDYYDGMLARRRNQITRLGQLLDPLADKLLLVGTLVPMLLLSGAGALPWADATPPGAVLGPVPRDGADPLLPFVSLLGRWGLPWWIFVVVVGREIFMTVFRQAAARRGVVIAAIGPAKWKTGFQSTWVGAAYFWFFAATLAAEQGWTATPWVAFAHFNGLVGIVTMIAATALTLYSLALYLRRFGGVFWGVRARG